MVEDIDRAGYGEQALFHLLNLAREKGLFVLLTAREPPARFGCALPDLLSRLNGLPVVEIGAPDEALLKTVMLKHFADRQLDIDPKVLDFLALHVERSLEAAALAVAAVDRAALATRPQDQPPARGRGARHDPHPRGGAGRVRGALLAAPVTLMIQFWP